jgi:hypothetical protein
MRHCEVRDCQRDIEMTLGVRVEKPGIERVAGKSITFFADMRVKTCTPCGTQILANLSGRNPAVVEVSRIRGRELV